MLQFVDSFSCLLSERKDLLVLHLTQEEPCVDVLDDDTQAVSVRTNEVASIVMEPEIAINLCRSIAQLFQGSDDTVAESNLDTAYGESDS